MGSVQDKFFIFLFISALCSKISDQTPTCGNNSFFIQYPFKLLQEGQHPHHKSHHHNQFILKCNTQGFVVLDLPFSGEFYVRDIDYFEQKIQLYDPGNCLPGRLKNLSLSSSPFAAATYQNYTFFSCPPESLTSSRNFSVISCLSNSTASILATPLPSMADQIRNLTGCKVIYSLQTPVSSVFQYEFNGIDSDLQLTWNATSCKGDCRGTSSRKPVLTVFVICLVTISVTMLGILFCIGCCLSFIGVMVEIEETTQGSHSSKYTRIWEVVRITLHPASSRPQPSSPSVARVPFDEFSLRSSPSVAAAPINDEFSLRSSPSVAAAPINDEFSLRSSTEVPSTLGTPLRASSLRSSTEVLSPLATPPEEFSLRSSPSVAADPIDEFSDPIDEFSLRSLMEVPSMAAASNDEPSTEELIIGGRECISGPNGDSCPICKEEYKASERLRLIRKCNHCFHADCVDEWLKGNKTCPICRTTVE